MEEELYEVLDGKTLLGQRMTLDTAMILIKGYFEKYWQEPNLAITIRRMARCDVRAAMEDDLK